MGRAKLILVVDGDESSLFAMHRQLAAHHKWAQDKQRKDAPGLIDILAPDLLITDYQIPLVKEIELLEWIHSAIQI